MANDRSMDVFGSKALTRFDIIATVSEAMSAAITLSRRTYIVAPVNGGAISSNVILPLTSGTVFIPFHILCLVKSNEDEISDLARARTWLRVERTKITTLELQP